MQVHSNTETHAQFEELILACQPWVERMARKFAREWFCVEFEDFVQIGMLEVCKNAPHAFEAATNPMAYLCKAAKNEMFNEINRMCGLSTTSLEAPLTSDGSFSLVDLLPDNSSVPVSRPSKQVRALNGAIRRLSSSRQRAVLRRNHALSGYGAHSWQEMASSPYVQASSRHMVNDLAYSGRKALQSDARLRKVMGMEVVQ